MKKRGFDRFPTQTEIRDSMSLQGKGPIRIPAILQDPEITLTQFMRDEIAEYIYELEEKLHDARS